MQKTVKVTHKQLANVDNLVECMIKLGISIKAKGYKFSSFQGPFFDENKKDRIYIVDFDIDNLRKGE